MNRLSEFYDGKSIFMTGASGYLGSILLEILLRCFPGIVRVYVLLRAKKGVKPEDRKAAIFKKLIFCELLKRYPNISDKVEVVTGDIALSNLGMSDEDILRMTKEVSIVFHCAALINFMKPERILSLANSRSTDTIIEFCRKLKKLDVLVYTSTAFSNAHVVPNTIEEKVYRLPHTAQRFLDEMENGDDESFAKLVSECNATWPNSYTFSKCLAENILQEKAADLPVVIIRPSIIVTTLRGPVPGYVEDGTGIFSLSIGVGKGFIKVIRCDPDIIFDVISADIVANTHIAAAWCVGTGRCASPYIANVTSGDTLKLTFSQFAYDMFDLAEKHRLPKQFQQASVQLVNSKFAYTLITLYEHHLPAFVLDLFLRIKGSKIKLRKMYQFYDYLMDTLFYFTSTTVNFQTNNFKSLSKLLPPEDNEDIYTDIYGLTFNDMMGNVPYGCEAFDWKIDKLSPEKRRRTVVVRSMVITSIKRITLLILFYLLYYIISKIFFTS